MRTFFLFLPLLLTGCSPYYLNVRRESVDENSLASTFVNSPDPRRENNSKGERFYISYRVPTTRRPLFLRIRLFYRNREEEIFSFPVKRRCGVKTYSVFRERYEKKGGILSYACAIVTKSSPSEEGRVLKEWKAAFWVDPVIYEDGEDQTPRKPAPPSLPNRYTDR